MNENASLNFNGVAAISVADVDSNSASEQLTLTATGGLLSIHADTGVQFISGVSGGPSLVLGGTIDQLNAALAARTFTPPSNTFGSGSLAISINDLGNSGIGGPMTATAAVAITVNQYDQPPAITGPTAASVNENGKVTFSGSGLLSASDPDSGGNPEQLSLTATGGLVTLPALTGLTVVSGANASAALTVSGTLANLDAALNGISFTPATGTFGSASLLLSINDQGNSGVGGPLSANHSIAITVNKVSVPPPLAERDSYALLQNQALSVNAAGGVLANDVDFSGAGLDAVLVSSPSHGKLTLNADGSFSYTPDSEFNGSDQFTYEASNDSGTSAVTTADLTVNYVNQQPSLVPGDLPASNENAGPQVVQGVVAFVPGPSVEANQTALAYTVSNISNPSLFSNPPSVASGILTYTAAAGAFGTSTFDLVVQDSGGVANGGIDTSTVQTFTINVNEVNQVRQSAPL